MGDVAQILGITNIPAPAPAPTTSPLGVKTTTESATAAAESSSTSNPLPKQVYDAITTAKKLSDYDSTSLPPIVPHFVRVNNKLIQSSRKARPWCWAPFSSSARNDGLLLHHWVRAGVEYPEYPFARFNVHLDALSYRNIASNGGGGGGVNENHPNTKTSNGDVVDSDAFYKQYLQDDEWTQSETDTLLELCRVYELRWPVIVDRWIGTHGNLTNKKVEDLQHRYYTIGMILNQRLVEQAAKVEAENLVKALAASQGTDSSTGANIVDSKNKESLVVQQALATAISTSTSSAVATMVGNIKANMQPAIASSGTGTNNQATFDLETERQRRRILNKIWNRSKEEEMEEEELCAELKIVEAQIRKLKKNGGHILAATATAPGSGRKGGAGVGGSVGAGSTVATPASSRGPSPVPMGTNVSKPGNSLTFMAGGAMGATASAQGGSATGSYSMLNAQFLKAAPKPTPGTPYLQSGRLVSPATGGQMGINKTTLKRMNQVLKELNIPDRPTPTKRTCDMYDHVRKGVLTLLSLQKVTMKRESEAVSRRNKLEKIAGEAVVRDIAAKAEAARMAALAAEKAAAAAEKAKAAAAAAANASGGKKSGSGGGKGGGGGGSKSGGRASGGSKGSKKKKASGDKGGTKRKAPSKKSTSAGAGGKGGTSSASATSASGTGASGAGQSSTNTSGGGKVKSGSASSTTVPAAAPAAGTSPAASAAKGGDADGGSKKKRARKN